jgi:hypothetical protein
MALTYNGSNYILNVFLNKTSYAEVIGQQNNMTHKLIVS